MTRTDGQAARAAGHTAVPVPARVGVVSRLVCLDVRHVFRARRISRLPKGTPYLRQRPHRLRQTKAHRAELRDRRGLLGGEHAHPTGGGRGVGRGVGRGSGGWCLCFVGVNWGRSTMHLPPPTPGGGGGRTGGRGRTCRGDVAVQQGAGLAPTCPRPRPASAAVADRPGGSSRRRGLR